MKSHSTDCPVLIGIVARTDSDWRGALAALPALGVQQIALFLAGLDFETRRELYRTLDTTSLITIPYVQLANDTKDWELPYLTEKFGTSVFSVAAIAGTEQLITSLGTEHAPILLENPEKSALPALFTDEAITRCGTAGICLDAGALERNRLHDKKNYEAVIAALDHNSVGAAFVTPIAEFRFQEMFKRPQRLSSLHQLHYLQHFPTAYLAKIVALKLENSLEEQLEIQAYLQSILRRSV